MKYQHHYSLTKPDSGLFAGYYLVVTDDGEILEIFEDLPSAEQWLAGDEGSRDGSMSFLLLAYSSMNLLLLALSVIWLELEQIVGRMMTAYDRD